MPILTGNFGKALWPGINKWYGDAYTEFPVEYTDIFTKNTSRKNFEEDVGTSMFGLLQQKGENAAISYDTANQGFVDRYTHVVYALGFSLSAEVVEDDLYDVIGKKKAQALAFSARQTKEVNAANILNRAFNASFTFGDGVSLINASHPNVAGGTWANKLAVDSDLSEAALEQAVIDLGKYTNDRGLRISIMPKKLIVPVDLLFDASKIMQTEYEVGTNNNTKNIVKTKFPGGVAVNHYLTDTDAWFIVTSVQDGMKYFERRPDSFSQENDFDTDNAKYKVTGRYSFGCSDKRGIYGTPGA
jgi:hypothetical protein